MQTDNNTLINELSAIADRAANAAQQFKTLDASTLRQKKDPEAWSVLECLEHLNLYGDFYLPAIEKSLLEHRGQQHSGFFRSGLIGNYFAGLMKGSKGRIKKMRSPKDKDPRHAHLSVTTIDRFLKQQELLASLLRQARQADLTRIKVPISLTRLIRLRLGDTLRFYVYHIERHIHQAEKAVSAYSPASSSVKPDPVCL